MPGMSAYPSVLTSPATCTRPVVTSVSTATRLPGSCSRSASRIESEIWSQILSWCPSVTDSEVHRRRAAKIAPVVLRRARSPARQCLRRGRYPGEGSAPARPGPRRGSDEHVEYAVGHRQLVARGLAHYRAGSIEHRDGVLRGAETLGPADPVEDEEVDALAGRLVAGHGEQPIRVRLGLGGEDDHHLSGGAARRELAGGEGAQDVGVPDEAELVPLPHRLLLELRVGDSLRTVVGDGGGHHDD